MKSKLLFALLMPVFGVCNPVGADPTTRVYECNVNGEHVFSDHACGDDAVQRDVTVTSRMDTISVSSTNTTTLKRSRKSSVGASTRTETEKRRQQCKRIQNSRDALIEKMRAGYTAKQDERLHNRLRTLDNQYFELRCSGIR